MVGGMAKGKRLRGAVSSGTRATTERVRAAIFNILYGESYQQGRVLDLFAGSGSLGKQLFNNLGIDAFIESLDLTDSQKATAKATALTNLGIMGDTNIDHYTGNGVIKVNIDNSNVDNEGVSGPPFNKIGQINNPADKTGTIE